MELKNSLITHMNPKSPISEAYRVLRTNIQFSSIDNSLKTIVVTSAGPGEGKTTTISNLAITFAQSNAKTLLIDTDLRKPKVHKLFNFTNLEGLTNLLMDKSDYSKCIRQTYINGLDVLTSGPIPPNPSELLSSDSMKELIYEIEQHYDIILMDAPPIVSVTDAAILSTLADGTILVTASEQVEIDAVNNAKELLNQVNANIIGIVLNKIAKDTKGGYYYYYYGEDK